jgi:hypothetical protein
VEGDYDSIPSWTTVIISKQRAGKIIEHLAAEGFLDRASDVKPAKSYPVPKLKSYSLTVRTTVGPHLYEHMPWGLDLLKRVEGLRKVMAGNRDATKALDKILAPLKVIQSARTARGAFHGQWASKNGKLHFVIDHKRGQIPVVRNPNDKKWRPENVSLADGVLQWETGRYLILKKGAWRPATFDVKKMKKTGHPFMTMRGWKKTQPCVPLASATPYPRE